MYSIIAVTANSSCIISNIQFIILYFVIYLQQDYNKCKTYVWCACKSTYRDWLRNYDLHDLALISHNVCWICSLFAVRNQARPCCWNKHKLQIGF